MNWLDFWNGNHSIYVCERHKIRHHQRIGEDIIRRFNGRLKLVVDYGCGEALSAIDIAQHCDKLILSDAAPSVRLGLMERYHDASNITIMSPEEVLALPPLSLDCIIINSVLQYLASEETASLLESLSHLVASEGRIIIGDIIPPDHTVFADAGALLHFAWQEQFMTEAMIGLMRTFMSDYRKIRAAYGLTCYSERDIEAMGNHVGLITERTPLNIGHDQGRMTFEMRKALS